jgi:DNA-binding MarR family transcriptional regulator
VGDKGDLHARSSGQRANRGDNAGPVTEEDVRWLIGHLRVVVATSSAVWAGRGMTLLQLTVLHFIRALSPVTLTDLAQVLGTKPPATSAIVDRLSHAGLVHRTPDTQDRRRIQLSITAAAEPIIGDTDPDTARRLLTVLSRMSPQSRRQLIDILMDVVRRSAE